MSVFYTSDTHFGHTRVIELCDRPFGSVAEMDDLLVEWWNLTVKPSDIVYHMGDVTSGALPPLEHIRKLNGRKILIAGNHDACHPMHREWLKYLPKYLDAGFEAVMPFARRKIGQIEFLMSHFPYNADHTDEPRYGQYRLRNNGLPLVHGHVHTLYTERDLGLNVGVDRWNYVPVSEDIIVDWLKRVTA